MKKVEPSPRSLEITADVAIVEGLEVVLEISCLSASVSYL